MIRGEKRDCDSVIMTMMMEKKKTIKTKQQKNPVSFTPPTNGVRSARRFSSWPNYHHCYIVQVSFLWNMWLRKSGSFGCGSQRRTRNDQRLKQPYYATAALLCYSIITMLQYYYYATVVLVDESSFHWTLLRCTFSPGVFRPRRSLSLAWPSSDICWLKRRVHTLMMATLTAHYISRITMANSNRHSWYNNIVCDAQESPSAIYDWVVQSIHCLLLLRFSLGSVWPLQMVLWYSTLICSIPLSDVFFLPIILTGWGLL